MYVNLFYIVFIIYFLLMNCLIISLGEQNFPAVEELNNAEITDYGIVFFFSMHISDAEKFLLKEIQNQTFEIVII